MSSDDEQTFLEKPTSREKKKRLQKSCDNCRKRKSDSANSPNGRCSSCNSFNIPCTHSHEVMKRGPKNRNSRDIAFLQDPSKTSAIPPASEFTPASSPSASQDDNLTNDELAERFEQFSFDSMKNRFFGSSSGFMLVKSAISIKEEFLGRPLVTQFRRPEFWKLRPWEVPPHEEDVPRYVYPETDLILALVDLYFININQIFPLLHRPSFQRSVEEKLHVEDHRFGALLLAVLAVGSRYSDDPRVFVEGSESKLSCGWDFFNQVQTVRKSLFDEPSIYEVQRYFLLSVFTMATSSPQACWLYVGLGMRFLQERGEHRRKREGNTVTLQDELWKRAFWCLLCLDKTICAFVGRPSAVHVEDYDVDLPLEIDDEYLEHPDPKQAFKQPPGKPSLITFFICHIKLCELLGSTLRRMYASHKSRVLLGLVGPEWEQRTVAELDSAMNEFTSSIPSHLSWDPNRSGVFFDQSAVLYTMYYSLQISIHRPFIHKPTALTLPSLTICTSAARCLIQVADTWLDKMQRAGVFVAALVLLLNIFGMKRAGVKIDILKELVPINAALKLLKFQESRWQTAGRLWEILQELKSWDGQPPPKPKPKISAKPTAQKRDTSIQEAEEAGTSVFTGQAPIGTSSVPSVSYANVADELSSHAVYPPTESSPTQTWSQLVQPSVPGHDISIVSSHDDAGLTIEQLLAATVEYDHTMGLGQDTDHIGGAADFANMVVDEDLLSWWETAPTTFANMPDWDAYVELMNTGPQWPMAQPTFDERRNLCIDRFNS
ncbi:Zn(2)-C6 fungal-type domain-containing protein, partial [Favolaschia claudopus]